MCEDENGCEEAEERARWHVSKAKGRSELFERPFHVCSFPLVFLAEHAAEAAEHVSGAVCDGVYA